MFQSAKQKRLSCAVFGIYSVLLVWLVLFKFATNFSALPSMRGINLIPFYYSQETGTHLKEVICNVIVFIPPGAYLQIFKEKQKTAVKCIIIFLTSLLFEVVQFIFAIGASDITDVLGNILGGIIGILLCIMMKKAAPRKFVSILNVLGILIESVFIGLFVLLLIANG